MLKYQLTLEYLGKAFLGVQQQPGLRTVEGLLRKTLDQLNCGYENLVLAARTDSGVGARGQVFSFEGDIQIPIDRFVRVVNRCLPPDMRVLDCRNVGPTFHARGDARFREYRYWFSTTDVPLAFRASITKVDHPLNLRVLNQLASHLVGYHDFSGFEKLGSTAKSSSKLVLRSEFFEVMEKSTRFFSSLNLVCYVIVADSFLYRMVRNLVGAMLLSSVGKLSEDQFLEMLDTGIRRWKYVAAPPEGLELFKIYY